jgi:ubiquinone/menaquinone biosynthesis C-methylase UbiE
MVKNDADWWTKFFPAFRPIFDILPAKLSNAEAHYLIRKLGLTSGKKFLDCPCGIGRISIPLAKKGIKLTGVDITQIYLDELSQKAARMGLKINLVHCDMRRIDFNSEFDGAGNLWTSFGYFSKESDNLLVLKKIYRALKPGGKFMLHVINRDWVVRNFRANDWFEVRGVKVFEQRRLILESSVSDSIWHYLKDGKETICRLGIRMYSYHEILEMMRRAGFVDIEGFGSMKDEPVSWDHRMMFIIGTKSGKSGR